MVPRLARRDVVRPGQWQVTLMKIATLNINYINRRPQLGMERPKEW